MTNMPATMKMEYKIGINAPLVRREAKTLMVEGDRCANTIVIEVMDGLEPADLAGCSVSAIMKRSDGARPFVQGTVVGNVVTVCLNESFYAVPGSYELLVRLTHTDGTKRVILWLNGWINDEGQGDVIDTENVVLDLEDLLAQIDAMEQATANANAATEAANAAATQAVEIATTKGDEAVQVATDKGNEAVQIATEQVEAQNQAIAKIATDLLTKAPAIECEASGSLVTVTDAAAQPAVQLVTHIEPVQEGEGDPSPDNVRPISGWDVAAIHGRGNNLCSPFAVGMGTNDVTGAVEEKSTQAVTDFIPVNFDANDGYIWSNIINNLTCCVYFYNRKKEYLGRSDAKAVDQKMIKKTTLVANLTGVGGEVGYIRLWQSENVNFDGKIDSVTKNNYMLNAGNTALPYEPYQGQTLTADLPEAVYGGTLDWGTGVLTVTRGMYTITGDEGWALGTQYSANGIRYDAVASRIAIAISSDGSELSTHYPNNGENALGSWCNSSPLGLGLRIQWHYDTVEELIAYLQAQYAAGTPVQVAYTLLNPYTIQLTPQQLEMLRGTNNLRSDTGDTDLVYVADTKLYIDQAIEAALNTTAEE